MGGPHCGMPTMPKVDRVPGPSAGKLCHDCGYEWAVVTTSATAKLDVAKHLVRHARWDLDGGRRPVWTTNAVVAALWLVDRLNARITDLEVEVDAADDDLSVANALIGDLKADLAAIEEGRH